MVLFNCKSLTIVFCREHIRHLCDFTRRNKPVQYVNRYLPVCQLVCGCFIIILLLSASGKQRLYAKDEAELFLSVVFVCTVGHQTKGSWHKTHPTSKVFSFSAAESWWGAACLPKLSRFNRHHTESTQWAAGQAGKKSTGLRGGVQKKTTFQI